MIPSKGASQEPVFLVRFWPDVTEEKLVIENAGKRSIRTFFKNKRKLFIVSFFD
jgi:hypothetical protein